MLACNKAVRGSARFLFLFFFIIQSKHQKKLLKTWRTATLTSTSVNWYNNTGQFHKLYLPVEWWNIIRECHYQKKNLSINNVQLFFCEQLLLVLYKANSLNTLPHNFIKALYKLLACCKYFLTQKSHYVLEWTDTEKKNASQNNKQAHCSELCFASSISKPFTCKNYVQSLNKIKPSFIWGLLLIPLYTFQVS